MGDVSRDALTNVTCAFTSEHISYEMVMSNAVGIEVEW